MIQGMTGFAERRFASETIRLKIAIKSLNHRFFDWSCRGTPLGDVENRLRQGLGLPVLEEAPARPEKAEKAAVVPMPEKKKA